MAYLGTDGRFFQQHSDGFGGLHLVCKRMDGCGGILVELQIPTPTKIVSQYATSDV